MSATVALGEVVCTLRSGLCGEKRRSETQFAWLYLYTLERGGLTCGRAAVSRKSVSLSDISLTYRSCMR
eukprot:4450905-Pleurochrysis_carterae.AAC.1